MPIHHDHDPELVMGLAESSHDIDDPAMRAQVDNCDECLEEVRLQRRALSVLRQAPAVRLDDLESVRLRRLIASTLGHEQPVQVEMAPPRRRIAWLPLASAAAVLLAIVMVAPSLDLVGGADDAGDFETALDEAAEADPDADAGAGADGAGTAASFATDQTLSVAAEEAPPEFGSDPESAPTTMAGDPAGTSDDVARVDDQTLAPLGEILDLVIADGAEGAAAVLGVSDTFTYEPSPPDVCVVEGAIAVGGLLESSTFGVVQLGVDGPRVVVTLHLDPGGGTHMVAHDLTTCAVLLVAP